MSMIWLVAPQEDWTSECAEVLSGFFAVRRISGLVSLNRLLRMDEVPVGESFVCAINFKPNHDLMEIHSTLAACLKIMRADQLCVLGFLDKDQAKLVNSFGVSNFDSFYDFVLLAKSIRTMIGQVAAAKKNTFTEKIIRIGDIEVDRELARLRVLATGFEEPLTPKEVRIIQVLSACVNQVVGRDELVSKVWLGVRVSASTIDSHMSRLRRKIDQSFECRLETQYGNGWKMAVRGERIG